jgi:hypothetical protein
VKTKKQKVEGKWYFSGLDYLPQDIYESNRRKLVTLQFKSIAELRTRLNKTLTL